MTQLKTNYKYDLLAEALYGREVEYFHYEFDKKNFEKICESEPEGEYKTTLLNNIQSIKEQMRRVRGIIDALESQITDPEEYKKALLRSEIKRETNPIKKVAIYIRSIF